MSEFFFFFEVFGVGIRDCPGKYGTLGRYVRSAKFILNHSTCIINLITVTNRCKKYFKTFRMLFTTLSTTVLQVQTCPINLINLMTLRLSLSCSPPSHGVWQKLGSLFCILHCQWIPRIQLDWVGTPSWRHRSIWTACQMPALWYFLQLWPSCQARWKTASDQWTFQNPTRMAA